MSSQLIEEASKVVESPQVLINLVSKRVRQLSHGHRPLVETDPWMSFPDIALKEIIEGKVRYDPAQSGAGQEE
jgi:DNA-directed RNA polymerase subunit omega